MPDHVMVAIQYPAVVVMNSLPKRRAMVEAMSMVAVPDDDHLNKGVTVGAATNPGTAPLASATALALRHAMLFHVSSAFVSPPVSHRSAMLFIAQNSCSSTCRVFCGVVGSSKSRMASTTVSATVGGSATTGTARGNMGTNCVAVKASVQSHASREFSHSAHAWVRALDVLPSRVGSVDVTMPGMDADPNLENAIDSASRP